MEQYIVSARKYRPATFDTVIGQRALTTTLLNAIRTGKLAHAYLFCGPRGVGKTTCARIFAKTINCEHLGPNGEPCNECESCRAFDEGRSMNIHELDAASNNSVDDIRELIDQVRIPPQTGRYKVFIIDEVHMLSQQAFNAFLKTLEEPPHYVIFILATTEKHKILPTILSRCQVYDFARITVQSTIDHLRFVAEKEGYQVEDQALAVIAQKADGGMRDALSIFDQMVSFTGGHITYQSVLDNLNILDSEYYFRTIDLVLNHDIEQVMLLLNEIVGKGFDPGNFIAGLATHLRDLLMSRDARTLPLLEVSEAQRQRYHEQAMRCQPRFVYRAIRLCNECDLGYRQSRNKRLQVELCLIEMAQEDDEAGAGRRPTTILKPLFKQPAAQGATAVAPKSVEPKTTEPKPIAPKSVAEKPKEKPEPAKPIRSLNLQGTSIRTKTPDPARVAPQPQEQKVEPLTSSPTPLTSHTAIQLWQEFANTLPQSETAMAQRMRAIIPEVLSDNSFAVTAGNAIIAKALNKLSGKVEAYFSQRLLLPQVKMEVRVATIEQSTIVYSKTEQFRIMLEESSTLRKLHEAFSLEIN